MGKKKVKKLYQPVVDCTHSQILYTDPVKARHKLMEMIQELPYWGDEHYFDRWLKDAEVGDIVGFPSECHTEKTLEAYIDVFELEE